MQIKEIYCDGACMGNPGVGAWALQAHYLNDYVEEQGGVLDLESTNNHAEMAAVYHAVSLAKKNFLQVNNETPEAIAGYKIIIYSDSSYVIRGINEWSPGWIARNWKGVANTEIWQKFLAHLKGTEGWLNFVWIRGHDGHENQERVDQIASDLARAKPVQFFYGRPKPKVSGVYPVYIAVVDSKVMTFKTWDKCRPMVIGKSGAKFKRVKSGIEREQVLANWGIRE